MQRAEASGERCVRLVGGVGDDHAAPGRPCRQIDQGPVTRRQPRRAPHGDSAAQRAIPEHVAFGCETGRVVLGVSHLAYPSLEPSSDVIDRLLGVVAPIDEGGDVVRPTRFGGRADHRTLPSPERLALHDRPRDTSVDVEVARFDGLEPVLDLVWVERMQPRRQTELGAVLDPDRVAEVVGPDDAEHRAEAFGASEPGTGLHADPDPRRPEPAVVGATCRLEQPTLARFEPGERSLERLARPIDQRRQIGDEVARRADSQRRRSVANPFEEARVVVERRLDDRQAGSRALLTGVTEGGSDQVGNGPIDVGGSRDRDRVLAAGLRVQTKFRSPRVEHRRRGVGTGQDHGGNVRVGDEPASDVAVGCGNELEHVAGHSGVPAQFRDQRRRAHGLWGRFEDHGVPGGEGGEDTAGRDREGEVPRWSDDYGSARRSGGALHLRQPERLIAVVTGEVDRLGDLRVALGDGLAGLGNHDRQHATSVLLEHVADGVHDLGPPSHPERCPLRLGGTGCRDARLDRGDGDVRSGCDDGIVNREVLGDPLPVGGVRPIGVGCVDERRLEPHRLVLDASLLCAPAFGSDRPA